MGLLHCDREQQVLEAVRSGRGPADWDEPLRAHVAACAICRDVALVSAFLLQESEWAAAEVRLPDPELVWWKAQLLARRAAAERAVLPIALTEKLAGAGAVALFLTGIVLNWSYVLDWSHLPSALRWLTDFLPTNVSRFPDLFQDLWSLQMPLLLATGGSLLLLLALSLYAVWAEG